MASKTMGTLALVAGGIALTALGLVTIPPIINSVSRKVYRASNNVSDIDLDNLGPEIVKKTDVQSSEG